ncbi:cyclic nucleotide-binding domain-containing protein [Sporomusa sphaeroides]|uniref:Cyclic nucleotide-binding domain protein n=1 Tax=Sporomusa sphaeroides DSM 2875 TaxID=1337886 RepID=A0ABP2C8R4_9FIRM|nr:cyclic nucleotide-binding domain-containing protein [Sporomusa sphaeroides]OLS57605.1 cyclic nucleotide-binding domain protein [Sporomusa sphaeroides DSM 2875]CVK20699.1 Cyclic nucleotide-binding domain protein [Sporomusa sphaeroides DSM 2875]
MITNNEKTNSCSTIIAENSIEICVAKTPAEKRAIYHFRYQIYVEEMSKHLVAADHDNKLLYDELDEWAILLYAKVGSEIIATYRINIGTMANFPQKIIEFLALDTFNNGIIEHGSHKIAYATKVMVTPAHRSSPALYLFMAKCYEICCYEQVQFLLGACNFHLLRLYEQLGFRRYYKNFLDPGYGLLVPLAMLIDDVEHLRKLRSPLFRIARKRQSLNTKAIEWFDTAFTGNFSIINSQLTTEEELWSILCKRLHCPPTAGITLLQNLSETEAKKLLHNCGILVKCDPDDIITFQGDVSYTYNILISGKLKSLTVKRPNKEYVTPGQHFGANGLTEQNTHTEDIAATSSTEILALSGIAFQKFYRSHPEIAHKVVKSIINSKKKLARIK